MFGVKLFVESIEKEKQSNAHKGVWEDWTPHPYELHWELTEHVAKLQKALRENNLDNICKYSCSVGLYAEKAFTVFGKPTVCRKCKGEGVWSAVPYDEGQSHCDDCNGTGKI